MHQNIVEISTKLLTIDIVVSILKKKLYRSNETSHSNFIARKNFILNRHNISGFNNINHEIEIHAPIYVSSPNNNRDNPIMKHVCAY